MALERARLCGIEMYNFQSWTFAISIDASLKGQFDFVFWFENIEHILDDRKLMLDMAFRLKLEDVCC